jgi:hypothetical protein
MAEHLPEMRGVLRMTSYMVFRRTSVREGTPTFQLIGRADAHNAKAAVAAVVAAVDDPEAQAKLHGETLAACPAASWREQTVAVVTETRVRVQ